MQFGEVKVTVPTLGFNVETVKYDSIFAFMYSPREGTVASKMPDQIPLEEKKRRVNALLALEKRIQKQEGKR